VCRVDGGLDRSGIPRRAIAAGTEVANIPIGRAGRERHRVHAEPCSEHRAKESTRHGFSP
jgi:hypothetical protein